LKRFADILAFSVPVCVELINPSQSFAVKLASPEKTTPVGVSVIPRNAAQEPCAKNASRPNATAVIPRFIMIISPCVLENRKCMKAIARTSML
jgi:hypothetical protein